MSSTCSYSDHRVRRQMRAARHAFLYGFFLCLLACSVDTVTENDLYGRWKGQHQGQRLDFVFRADKSCVLRFEDPATRTTTEWTGVFETDFSKLPIPLTIRNLPQLPHPLHTILRFEADRTLTLAPFAPRWRLRPTAFPREGTITLAPVTSTE